MVTPLVVQVLPPGDDVTEYAVIAAPPVFAGAFQEIVVRVFRFEEARTAVGAPGTVDGTAAAETASSDAPLAFVAATENT